MRATRLLLTAAATVAALALAGCGDDEPTATPAAETTSASPTEEAESPEETASEPEPDPGGRVAAITIEGDSALPIAEQVEMQTGEALTLAVDSDRAGELHVHSTPEQVVEFPAGASEHALTFDKPGTVDIEEHDTGVLLFRVLVS